MEAAMFRVKGENRQDRQYHVDLIWDVHKKDIGAAVILAAAYLEWCIRRCILALGASPVAELRKKLNERQMDVEGLKGLWKSEVCSQHKDIDTLPNLFDLQRLKPRFDNTPLTWQSIDRARRLRNDLVHGAKCDPLEKHGRKHLEILIAASDVVINLVEKHKSSIFRIIRRGVKKASSAK